MGQQFITTMRQTSLPKQLINHTSASFDVTQDPKRLDGLLPNQRSAAERRQSFLQRSNSSSSPSSGSSSSMAFDFCGSDSSTASDDDDDELALVLQFDANKTPSSPKAAHSESTILKIKTQEASLELVTANTMSLSLKRHGVRFGNVTVHYHPTILGDNPSVSSGAPLALGWQRVGDAETYTVDDAAQAAAAARRPKMSSSSSSSSTTTQLKLGPGARQRRLQQAGVPYLDIVRRTETCDSARMAQLESIRRAKTVKKQKVAAVPPARRKFWQRFFFFARA